MDKKLYITEAEAKILLVAASSFESQHMIGPCPKREDKTGKKAKWKVTATEFEKNRQSVYEKLRTLCWDFHYTDDGSFSASKVYIPGGTNGTNGI